MNYPIDRDIVRKKAKLPEMLAELAEVDQDRCLGIVKMWGEEKKPITMIYDELSRTLQDEAILS